MYSTADGLWLHVVEEVTLQFPQFFGLNTGVKCKEYQVVANLELVGLNLFGSCLLVLAVSRAETDHLDF